MLKPSRIGAPRLSTDSARDDPSLLLNLQLTIQQVQGLFIRLGGPNDRKHPLARLVVRVLGDTNSGAGETSDFRDFGTGAADDAADHVRGDRDVLGLEVSGRGGRSRGGVGLAERGGA